MRSLLLAMTACIFFAPAPLDAQVLPHANGLAKLPQPSEQRFGRHVELVVDDTGTGLATGSFDLAIDPDRYLMVYFPEDIQDADALPSQYFRVNVLKRRVLIYTRKRRLEPDARRTLTVASPSIAVNLNVRPAGKSDEPVDMVTVRRRSEKEAREAELTARHAEMRARTEQEYEERHSQLDREVEERADEKALERFLAHGISVRPTIVQGDVDPHAPGAPPVTLSDVQGMWWGANDMLVFFTVQNTGETAFDWGEAQVFGPERSEDHAGAAHVQMPAIPVEGLVGRLPVGKRARGAVLVQGAKALTGPMTILLGEKGGGRPAMVTVGHWMPLQTEQALTGWEIRPAPPPDPEKDKVSLHLQGVYGAVWLGDGAGLDKSDATSLKGLGVRAQYAFNRYIAVEGEALGASTGTARFEGVTYDGMQGDLTRSASLGRVQFGGVLRLGKQIVPLLRLGVGLQGASHRGTLTTATGEAPGPDAFEFDTIFFYGTGLDIRLGDHFRAGITLSGVQRFSSGFQAIEAGIHLGYAWKP
jgi:hypothetical protein